MEGKFSSSCMFSEENHVLVRNIDGMRFLPALARKMFPNYLLRKSGKVDYIVMESCQVMQGRNVRLLTHESIVHYQIEALEQLLQRPLDDMTLTLNKKAVLSNIEFLATDDEIAKIEEKLKFRLFTDFDPRSFLRNV